MTTVMRELWTSRRTLLLTVVGAVLVAVVGIVALLWLLGRGADSADDAAEIDKMLDARPVSEGIAAAGGSCEASGAIDRRNCTLEGVQFQLAEGTWVRQSGERERECSQGQASRDTKVLTNRSWMIYTDDEAQLDKLRGLLASYAVPSEVMGYCDWDQ